MNRNKPGERADPGVKAGPVRKSYRRTQLVGFGQIRQLTAQGCGMMMGGMMM